MAVTHASFSKHNFYTFCDLLAEKDSDLGNIIQCHGYPPMWTRTNTFRTILLTILEQQVSLASAYAAYKKLFEKVIRVTPETIQQLSDQELRSCYLSRQKIVYARALSNAIITKQLKLKRFHYASDDEIRTELKKIKGIGDWTVDIYLIHVLRRTDIFPLGDLALVNSIKEVKKLKPDSTKEEITSLSESWRPYRSIATMILWHQYIKKRNIKLLM